MELIEQKRNESLKSFQLLDLAKTYSELFEIMWYSQVRHQVHVLQNAIISCFKINQKLSRDQNAKKFQNTTTI